jgi:hypothetical protein
VSAADDGRRGVLGDKLEIDKQTPDPDPEGRVAAAAAAVTLVSLIERAPGPGAAAGAEGRGRCRLPGVRARYFPRSALGVSVLRRPVFSFKHIISVRA